MTAATTFFSQNEKDQILKAVKEAENNTSGEIRVHVESRCDEAPLDRAAFLFKRLEMHKTQLRNGVLFYLAIDDRKFAILGDAGINAKVPSNFWDSTKQTVLQQFKDEDYAQGLAQGIRMAGIELKAHFPHMDNDQNELNDDISFGSN